MKKDKQKKAKTERKTQGLSKKDYLIISNSIAFFVLFIMASFEVPALNESLLFDRELWGILFKYLVAMCAFSIMSLVVYYLSIIADAISKKKTDDEQEKD